MKPTAKDKDYTLALGWALWFGLGLLVVGSGSLRSSILLAAPVVLNDPDPIRSPWHSRRLQLLAALLMMLVS